MQLCYTLLFPLEQNHQKLRYPLLTQGGPVEQLHGPHHVDDGGTGGHAQDHIEGKMVVVVPQ